MTNTNTMSPTLRSEAETGVHLLDKRTALKTTGISAGNSRSRKGGWGDREWLGYGHSFDRGRAYARAGAIIVIATAHGLNLLTSPQ